MERNVISCISSGVINESVLKRNPDDKLMLVREGHSKRRSHSRERSGSRERKRRDSREVV